MQRLTGVLVIVIGCLMIAASAWALSQPPGHFAYITNVNNNTVSFIDTDTRTVTRTVAVGNYPIGVTVGASGFTLYVVNQDSHTVSLIYTTSGTVYATIDTGGSPRCIVVNDEETFAYVTDSSANKVHIIDLVAETVVKSVTVGVAGDYPSPIAMDSTGEYIYVGHRYGTRVTILHRSGVVAGTVTVAEGPYGIAVHPSGSSIWVTNEHADIVSVINRYDWSVTTIPVGNRATGICFNRAGTYAYVANNDDNTVSVIKTATKAVVATIPVGDSPFGVGVDRSDRYLYVANMGSDNVTVIDTTTNSVIGTITAGNGPASVGQFMNASSIWKATADSVSLKATYPEEDAKGIVKLKNTTQTVDGTCYLYATYWRPYRLYCTFAGGAYLEIDNMSHLATENPKSKNETVRMNGSGLGAVYLPTNRFFPGFATFFDGKGVLKRTTVGGEVTSIVVTGKAMIHADTGVVGTATLRLTFSKIW